MDHTKNLAILSTLDDRRAWSTLMVDALPDLNILSATQCFSLYRYEAVSAQAQGNLFGDFDQNVIDGYRRKDNITDGTLSTYRGFYEDAEIGKEDIFFYVYGLHHSPTYKEDYQTDLMQMLPRIPKVKDFWGYSQAGRDLAELHLNYEKVKPFPLDEISSGSITGASEEAFDFYRVNKLSFGARKDRSDIVTADVAE